MNHMEAVQQQINITRSQFIHQLNEEITQIQRELINLSPGNSSKTARMGETVYQTMIARKRRLINQLQ